MDGIEETLHRHRSQLGSHISLTRVIGVGVWLLVTLTFTTDDYVGVSQQRDVVAIYMAFATIWFIAQYALPKLRPHPFVLVCALDLPLLTWLQIKVSFAYSPPSANAITMLAAIMVMIIGLSVLSLRSRTVLITATVAVALHLMAGAITQVHTADTVLSLLLLSLTGFGSFAAVNYIRQINLRTAEVRAQRIAMGRYFSPAVVNRITERQTQSQAMEITVLMCDLRGFTRTSEGLAPEQVVHWLNRYFDALVQVVFDHGGTVDKMMGDGLLVYFGAPEPTITHAKDAVTCALAMRARIAELNAESTDWPPYAIGVGLHTGEAILGNIGSSQRTDYTIIGDAVNVAARLEGLTKTLGTDIVVSEPCRQMADHMEYKRLEDTPIRGRTQPLALYTPD